MRFQTLGCGKGLSRPFAASALGSAPAPSLAIVSPLCSLRPLRSDLKSAEPPVPLRDPRPLPLVTCPRPPALPE
eukprot:2359814-Heterocapsa_arctica.AAC.2